MINKTKNNLFWPRELGARLIYMALNNSEIGTAVQTELATEKTNKATDINDKFDEYATKNAREVINKAAEVAKKNVEEDFNSLALDKTLTQAALGKTNTQIDDLKAEYGKKAEGEKPTITAQDLEKYFKDLEKYTGSLTTTLNKDNIGTFELPEGLKKEDVAATVKSLNDKNTELAGKPLSEARNKMREFFTTNKDVLVPLITGGVDIKEGTEFTVNFAKVEQFLVNQGSNPEETSLLVKSIGMSEIIGKLITNEYQVTVTDLNEKTRTSTKVAKRNSDKKNAFYDDEGYIPIMEGYKVKIEKVEVTDLQEQKKSGSSTNEKTTDEKKTKSTEGKSEETDSKKMPIETKEKPISIAQALEEGKKKILAKLDGATVNFGAKDYDQTTGGYRQHFEAAGEKYVYFVWINKKTNGEQEVMESILSDPYDAKKTLNIRGKNSEAEWDKFQTQVKKNKESFEKNKEKEKIVQGIKDAVTEAKDTYGLLGDEWKNKELDYDLKIPEGFYGKEDQTSSLELKREGSTSFKFDIAIVKDEKLLPTDEIKKEVKQKFEARDLVKNAKFNQADAESYVNVRDKYNLKIANVEKGKKGAFVRDKEANIVLEDGNKLADVQGALKEATGPLKVALEKYLETMSQKFENTFNSLKQNWESALLVVNNQISPKERKSFGEFYQNDVTLLKDPKNFTIRYKIGTDAVPDKVLTTVMTDGKLEQNFIGLTNNQDQSIRDDIINKLKSAFEDYKKKNPDK